MLKRLGLFAVAALALLSTKPACAQEPTGTERVVSFRLRAVDTSGEVTETEQVVKGLRVRTEIFGEEGSFVQIWKDDTVYSYWPTLRRGFKRAWPTKLAPTLLMLRTVDQIRAKQLAPSRAESMAGYNCDVYQYGEEGADAKATLWWWREQQFPVKLVMVGKRGTTTNEFINIRADADVPDSVFDIPAGISIVDKTTKP